VIATSVGGNPEIIGRDRYGTLVLPASWEDLHRGMREYLRSRGAFLEKAREARDYARDVYSVEKMACNYVHYYRQALAEQRN
jgi:glycosyltransferase involved in cell wall biosynthesis